MRAFDADIGAAARMMIRSSARRVERARRLRADRMRHRDMGDEAGAEEAFLAREGAVDELVRHHEGAGRQFFLQRAAGRDRDHVGDADALQGVDIGAVVDRGRRLDMAAAVARQEDEVDALERCRSAARRTARPTGFSRSASGRFRGPEFIDAAAADDAENRLGHELRCAIREEFAPLRIRHGAMARRETGREHGARADALRPLAVARTRAKTRDLVRVRPDLAVGDKQQARQTIRKIITPKPMRLRSSSLGSDGPGEERRHVMGFLRPGRLGAVGIGDGIVLAAAAAWRCSSPRNRGCSTCRRSP